MTMAKDDTIRIKKFAESYFQKSGQTEFPTIRYVARRLRMRQKEVLELVDCSDCMCSEYYHAEHKIGDRFINVMNP